MKRKKIDQNQNKVMKPKEIDQNQIPLDLMVEILTRLPVKSLIKFQCVSRIWLSIISSKIFINSFYSISSKRPRFVVAFTNGIYTKLIEKRLFFFSSSHKEHESSDSLVSNWDMTIPFLSVCNNSVSLYDSLHGFIGCSLLDGFLICNPSTRQVIVLPPTIASDMGGTCLGYDPVSDEFKALSLTASPMSNNDCVEHLVLTLKGDKTKYSWREIHGNNKVPPYYPVTMKLCINGIIYYGAWTPKRNMNPVIVCFDVRIEKLTFVDAPKDVVRWETESVLMNYKGNLASIVRYPYGRFHRFDLWVLENIEKQEWSKQKCVFPLSVWDYVGGLNMSFPGSNKAGEIILAPRFLSFNLRPFYIFYYNVDTKNIRRVRLEGVADDEEFRSCYGVGNNVGACNVFISPEHVENIRFL